LYYTIFRRQNQGLDKGGFLWYNTNEKLKIGGKIGIDRIAEANGAGKTKNQHIHKLPGENQGLASAECR